MYKNVLKSTCIILGLIASSNNTLNAAELRKWIANKFSNRFEYKQPVVLTESEKFVKELYQNFPQAITFLRMHEVPSSLNNKLNRLFTAEIKSAMETGNRSFLEKRGFEFYKRHVFIHKDFPEFVFKLPRRWFGISKDVLFNASRVWYANWIKTVQCEFAVPKKQIYFMKSSCPELAIVVVAQKMKFEEAQIHLSKIEREVLNKIKETVGYFDDNIGNVRNKMIIDTEAQSESFFALFTENPFLIYENTLMNKHKNRTTELKSKL